VTFSRFGGIFFCPFYKIPYLGFRKLQLQITPQNCTCRKIRVRTPYKIPYLGFRNFRPQTALKTNFRGSKSLSKLQNHFKPIFASQIAFQTAKFFSNQLSRLKSPFKPKFSSQTLLKSNFPPIIAFFRLSR